MLRIGITGSHVSVESFFLNQLFSKLGRHIFSKKSKKTTLEKALVLKTTSSKTTL